MSCPKLQGIPHPVHFKIEHGHEKHELMVFGAFPSNQPNEQPLMIVCVWFRLLRMGLVLGFWCVLCSLGSPLATSGGDMDDAEHATRGAALDAMRWDGRMDEAMAAMKLCR